MALTHADEYPSRPSEKQPWTLGRVFRLGAGAGVSASLKKHRPIELAFLFMVIATAAMILFGRTIPYLWWFMLALTLGVSAVPHVEEVIKKDAVPPGDTPA